MADAFNLTNEHLARLCEVNHFAVPDDRVIFFGFRGLTPADPNDHGFAGSQAVAIARVDYVHPRCVLGQWDRRSGTLAVYPGSTVPALRLFRPKVQQGGAGANRLMEGYYSKGYAQGTHRAGTETGHAAFRQQGKVAVRRTADDDDYDVDDRVELGTPHDNLHAAWADSVDSDRFSSLGCQVVVGRPDSQQHSGDTGPWKAFKDFAYGIAQTEFPYLLLPGKTAMWVATKPNKDLTRLRFGSSGELVEAAQAALNEFGHGLTVDGDFGPGTLEALLRFQTDEVGARSDDGVVGPRTAKALGIKDVWPGRTSSRPPVRKEEPVDPNRTVIGDQWATPLDPSTLRRARASGLLDGEPTALAADGAAGYEERQEATKAIIRAAIEKLAPGEPAPADGDLLQRAQKLGLFEDDASRYLPPPEGTALPLERERIVKTIVGNALDRLDPSPDWADVPQANRRALAIELLIGHGYSVDAAAGIVGNLDVESHVMPNRLEGSSTREPMNAEGFDKVRRTWTPQEIMDRDPDAERGPRRKGIGLAQWSYPSRREGLFKHEYEGKVLGPDVVFSMEAQIDYLVHELKTGFKNLDKILKSDGISLEKAAAEVIYDFERPGSIYDGNQRYPRDHPKVLERFEERGERARAALADYLAAKG